MPELRRFLPGRGGNSDNGDEPEYPDTFPEGETPGTGTGLDMEDLRMLTSARLDPPGDNIVRADEVMSVRFPVSEPHGYAYPHVETFVRDMQRTIGWYENAVYQREVAIADVARELSLSQFDNRSLQRQIEVFRVQGNPLVDADGEYITESRMPEAAPPPPPYMEPDPVPLVAALPEGTVAVDAETVELWGRLQTEYDAATDRESALLAQVEALREQAVALDEERQRLLDVRREAETVIQEWADACADRDATIADLTDQLNAATELSHQVTRRPVSDYPEPTTEPASASPPWIPGLLSGPDDSDWLPTLASSGGPLHIPPSIPLEVWAPELSYQQPTDGNPEADIEPVAPDAIARPTLRDDT